MSTHRPAAINATVRPIAEYGVDPRGHGLAFALASHGAAQLSNLRAVVAGPTWSGWTKPLQTMTGAAAAVAQGRAAAIAPRNSELHREKSADADQSTAAIFRSRMARGQR